MAMTWLECGARTHHVDVMLKARNPGTHGRELCETGAEYEMVYSVLNPPGRSSPAEQEAPE